MANFKVIYRTDAVADAEDGLTWEAGCPLQFEAIQISRNTETGTAYLQGKLRNVSDQTVRSFKARITVEYEDSATEDALFEPLDADVAAGATYELAPIGLKQGNATSAAGVVESAKLENGAWQSTSAPAPLPIPAPIGLSDAAVTERRIQIWGSSTPSQLSAQGIKAAAANRVEEHDGWWLCPCGQVNVDRSTCAQCNASLEALRDPNAENEGALTAAAMKHAETKAQKEAEQAAAQKKRNGLLIKAGIILAVLVVIAIIVLAVVVFPAMKQGEYEQALSKFDRGDYAAAAIAFDSLGDYEDAAEKKAEAEKTAAFLSRIAPFIGNSDLKTTLHAQGISDRSYDNCSLVLKPNRTCTVTVEASSEAAKALNGPGDWAGTWDPATEELTLPGFPLGETWQFGETRTQSGGMYGNARVIPGTSLQINSTDSDAYFFVFDEQ